MLTKKKLIVAIEQLPEHFTVDELIYHLLIIEKIEKANNQSLRGEVISEEELDRKMEKWFE